jgi:hypothetical protein
LLSLLEQTLAEEKKADTLPNSLVSQGNQPPAFKQAA